MAIKEKLKGIVINIIVALILISLAAAVVLTVYPDPEIIKAELVSLLPETFESFGETAVYAAIGLVAFVLANIIALALRSVYKKLTAKKALVPSKPQIPALTAKPETTTITEKEMHEVLEAMDNLLEKLPDAEVEKFLKSKESQLYKKVLKKYKVD